MTATHQTTYMVVEHYMSAAAVYERFRASGRMLPPGVTFVESWIDASLSACFQVMRAESRDQLDTWMGKWSDLVDFDVHEVMSSSEAASRFGPR